MTPAGRRRPSALLLVTEPWRSILELGATTVTAPQLARAPRGDGHPVLVLPGLLASDSSTVLLRRFLRRLGYQATGWQLGLNTGPTQDVVRRLPARLQALTDAAGAPATVIGWSLGGIYARALAVRSPELVRQVITLGSPYATSEPGQTHADAAYRLLSRRRFREATSDGPDPSSALSMPTTSIYSRLDGIVSWRVCREDVAERRESIAVPASHLGLGHHPAVLWVVADRLAQDPSDWRPFAPPRGMAAVFTVDRPA